MESLRLQDRTIPNVLKNTVDRNGERPFILYEDRTMNYREFDSITNQIGNSLISIGVEKGSKVSILMGNRPEFLETWIGLAKIGAIEVPVDMELKGEMLLHRLQNSEASVLVVEDKYLIGISEIKEVLSNIKQVFVYPDIPADISDFPDHVSLRGFQDLLRGPKTDPGVETMPQDIHAIMYTSGTSGPAKGVMVPHAQWTYVADYKNKACRTTVEDVIFNCYPLYNPTGQCETSFSALMAGAAVAHVDRFSASRFWSQIRKFKATEFVYMGGILSILLKQSPSSEEKKHECRLAWGCGCDKNIWEAVEKRWGIKVIEIYGLTESWPVTQYPWDAPRSKIGSIGKVVEAFEAKVFDENDNELSQGKVGEIVVRPKLPYASCAGYYRNAEATMEVIRNLWFHTGDLGYQDEDGYFYFVERKKYVMRVGGHMISPWDVEQAINKNAKILESVAFGVPSDLSSGEEECKVMVVLKANEEMTPEELLAHCKKYLPRYMLPRYIEFAHDLEKTPTLRIQRWKYKEKGIGAAWDRMMAGYVR